MDLVSGMRNAMTSCQRGGTNMGKLVKDRKKMLSSDSTAAVPATQAKNMYVIKTFYIVQPSNAFRSICSAV